MASSARISFMDLVALEAVGEVQGMKPEWACSRHLVPLNNAYSKLGSRSDVPSFILFQVVWSFHTKIVVLFDSLFMVLPVFPRHSYLLPQCTNTKYRLRDSNYRRSWEATSSKNQAQITMVKYSIIMSPTRLTISNRWIVCRTLDCAKSGILVSFTESDYQRPT